jgi:hypothetical protein
MSDDLDFYDLQARQQWDSTPGRRKFSTITGNMLRLEPGDVTEINRIAGELRQAALGKVADDDRCALSELPKDSCSHCRPRTPKPPVKVGGKYRLIEARYDGSCAVCDAPFQVGQTIARLEDGGYAGPCCRDEAGQ